MEDHKANVATPGDNYERMEDCRRLPRLLIGGTRALRQEENAALYLPPEEDEETHPGGLDKPGGQIGTARQHQSEWQVRVSRSVIFPFFSRAVRRAASAILAKPIVLKDDVPQEIRGTRDDYKDGWWENVDLEGNDGNVFFSRVAEDSLGDAGVSYVLVEHQKAPEGATLADFKAQGLRPYLVHVKAKQVLDPEVEIVNGRKRNKVIRIKARRREKVGEWGWRWVDQVRVLRAPSLGEDGKPMAAEGRRPFVSWEVWEKVDPDAKDSEWAPVEGEAGYMEPHTEIPLVPYYTGYHGWMEARTPFDDLAHLNILHTQKHSDLNEGFRINLGAQLHRSGITVEEAAKQRAIGSKRLLVSPPADAKAEWLERSGTAASVAMEDLSQLEARMLALSQEPHVRRTGSETATGRAIDAAEAKTETQAWTIAMRDHIESVLMFLAAYRGYDSGGSVDVVMPPRYSDQDIEALKVLVDMHVKTGGPRLAVLLEEAKRQGRLPDDLDAEQEAMMAGQAGMAMGEEGRMRSVLRPLMERMGMGEEEIEAMLEANGGPPGGAMAGIRMGA